jgi:hypothetical protein
MSNETSLELTNEKQLQQLEIAKLQLGVQKVQMDMQLAQADMYVQSGLLPPHIKTKEQAFLIMQQGKELGVPALAAFNNIAVISGKTTIGINLAQALVKKAGGTYRTVMDMVASKDGSDYRTDIEFTRNGISEIVTYKYSEAMIAGIATGTGWKKYPRQMMYARCFFLGARRVFPEILQGMYEHTEINPKMEVEIDNQGNTVYSID